MKIKLTRRSRFMLAAGISICVMLMCSQRTSLALFGRYRIYRDSQIVRCLPDYRWYLVDLQDHGMIPGALYSFSARGLKLYPDGTNMIKILKGSEGDHIRISRQRIYINGQPAGTGLPLALEAHYFMMGEHFRSYDSRYWGTVHENQIVGRAYPLF